MAQIKADEITKLIREQIDNLPQNSRNFLNFAALAPGARTTLCSLVCTCAKAVVNATSPPRNAADASMQTSALFPIMRRPSPANAAPAQREPCQHRPRRSHLSPRDRAIACSMNNAASSAERSRAKRPTI